MIFDAFIHLMHLIVGKGNWVADYFKKQQRKIGRASCRERVW